MSGPVGSPALSPICVPVRSVRADLPSVQCRFATLRLRVLDSMRILRFAGPAIALACALVFAAGTSAADMTYPPTMRKPVVDTYHGVAVTDDYRWLEDDNAPDVKAWVAEQNKVTRAYLDGIAQRPEIARRVAELLRSEDRPALRLRIPPATVRDEAGAAGEPAAARRAACRRQHRQGIGRPRPQCPRRQGPHDDRLLQGLLRRQARRRVAVRAMAAKSARPTSTTWRRASVWPMSCRA